MRTKKYKAIIEDRSYLEDLIWMSYRYCIGRKTIAAHSHAGDIAKYSFDHLSDDRKKFAAKDIRNEINDVLRWRNNISINLYGYDIPKDAFTMIIERFIEKYGEELPEGFDWSDIQFDIDNNGVHIDIFTGDKDFESLPSRFHDLAPWIKLANAFDIDQHKTVVTEFNGVREEHICFRYPTMDYSGKNIKMVWIDIENYRSNPSIDRYIDEQYIVEIR